MTRLYWTADGGGRGLGDTPAALHRWIRAHGSASIIVNGGDIYKHGRPKDFDRFLEQIDGNTADMCETAGNHDWETTDTTDDAGTFPSAYEAFWTRFAPPLSCQPIDRTKRGGARYDHVIDRDGWRLVFLDTGPCNEQVWPVGDPARLEWLRSALDTPGRAKIVFAHHSRLSRGKHGDVTNVDPLWRALFAADGTPLAALTMAGHDHNVSVYDPRNCNAPAAGATTFERGIHLVVNGAGGHGHDIAFRGTKPEFSDDDNFCLTRIDLIDAHNAVVEILSFGPEDPPAVAHPSVVCRLPLTV